MMPMALEQNQLDLWQLGFMFAVQKIDERIGKIDIQHMKREGNNNSQALSILDMADCNEVLPGGQHA